MGYFLLYVLANAALLGGLIGVIIASPIAGAVLTGLAVTCLLVMPTVRERWDRRRAVPRARAWLRTRPDPVTLAFAIGGPRTQAGLRLAELAAHEKWATTGYYPQALAGAATDPGRWQLNVVPDDLDVKGGPEATKGIVDDVKSIADDLGLRGGGL